MIAVGDSVPRRGNRFTRWLGRQFLYAFGWRVTGTFPDVPRAVIIAAPHTSNWDGVFGLAAGLALDIRLSFMAKESLFSGPFAGLVRWLGGIPVDRSAAGDVVAQTVQAIRDSDALIVGLAPEGTRKGAGQWKTGFWRIAREAGVPIVVVGFDYGRRRVAILATVQPGNDQAADLERIYALYDAVSARHPAWLSEPLARRRRSK